MSVSLHAGQRSIYLLQSAFPKACFFNIAFAARLTEAFDDDTLHAAWKTVVQRHATLNSRWQSSVDGVTCVVASHELLPRLQVEYLGCADIEGAMLAYADRPFDLAEEAPCRAAVFRQRSDAEAVLLLVVHHIAADYRAMRLVLDELSRALSAQRLAGTCDLPPARDPFAHYAMLDAPVAREAAEASKAFWLRKLSPPPAPTNLPFDRPRGARWEPACGQLRVAVDPALHQRVRAWARASKTTPAITYLSAFLALLHRLGGQSDLAVALTSSGRNDAASRELVAMLANPFVLRVTLDGGMTFEQAARATRTDLLQSLQHGDFPFSSLVEALKPTREAGTPPLAQVMFVWQDELSSDGPAAGPIDLSDRRAMSGQRGSAFDLFLSMEPSGDSCFAQVVYSQALFDHATISAFVENFQVLLGAGIERPNVPLRLLDVIAPAQLQFLDDDNRTELGFDRDATLHELVAARAREAGGRTAVVAGARSVSYAELQHRVQTLARELHRRGVGGGSVVGVWMARDIELLVSMLAVLTVGAAYLPLDPAFPNERIVYMVEDSRVAFVLVRGDAGGELARAGAKTIDVDAVPTQVSALAEQRVDAGSPAYIIYTSGSTGRPKGTVVTHRNAVNLFAGLDAVFGLAPQPNVKWLAVTSISFDISVLELLWTLARGEMVVLWQSVTQVPHRRAGAPKFSLFYFPGHSDGFDERYELLQSGARFADDSGFDAIWMPERHFHRFGGDYPNPAVTAGAVAALTRHVQIRSGSVVLPLHDPVRVAEEWAMVDRLSGGRVGMAFASGWQEDDFVLAPDNFERRKAITFKGIETVRRLWRGESITRRNGVGKEVEFIVRPRPVQRELPVWVTAAGNPQTFVAAGRGGFNVLTHLLGQNMRELRDRIDIYQQARRAAGFGAGHVTVMAHTLVAETAEEVRRLSEEPFRAYLRNSVELMSGLARSMGLDPVAQREQLVDIAYARFASTSGLFGTPPQLVERIRELHDAGADEIACLIDFGVPVPDALRNLPHLATLRRLVQDAPTQPGAAKASNVEDLIVEHGVTHLQCTPALLYTLLATNQGRAALAQLRVLLVGGERFPPQLASKLAATTTAAIYNMYGPTETTVWSAARRIYAEVDAAYIGGPVANTTFHVVDENLQRVPPGVAGELCIGGEGVSIGYWRRADITAQSFVPDPFTAVAGARMYRTGDLVRQIGRAKFEYLGRRDLQTKVRGVRIELSEVEQVLSEAPEVAQAVAVVRESVDGGATLIAFVSPAAGCEIDTESLRARAVRMLPAGMVPSQIVVELAMPMTPNGKLDRRALAARSPAAVPCGEATVGRTQVEVALQALWSRLLGLPQVGIHDNFFEIGGHSVLAAKMFVEMESNGLGPIAIADIFANPTISQLAQRLGNAGEPAESPDATAERARRQRAAFGRSARKPQSMAIK